MSEKLKRLEYDNFIDSVEIYGIYDSRLNNKKIRNYYLKKICVLFDLNFKYVIEFLFDKNYIVVKLCDVMCVKEW